MNRHGNTHLFAFAVWLLCMLPVQRAAAYTDHRNHKTDSLENLLKDERRLTDEQRMDAYKALMWAYLQTDGKRAADYARKAIALSYDHDWQNVRADAQRILGIIAYGGERWDEAEEYYQQALATTDSMRQNKRYTEDDIDDNLSALYGSVGNLYNMQDMALLAIEYYQKAMPIFEKHSWLESLTLLHHNVAELYLSMGNTEKALGEYQSAIKTALKTNDSLIVAVPRKGLSKIYIDEGNYEKAQALLTPTLAYFSAHRDEEPAAYAEVLALITKMNLLNGHEDMAKAKACINEAISYDNEELGAEIRRDIYAAAAMVAMRENNWQQALVYAKLSVHENDEDATFGDVGCYEMLAHIYMEIGDKAQARIYINKVRTMMERFATEHYQSGLSQMEVIYKTKKKESEIAQLTKERQWILWGGLLTALVLLLTATVFCLLWLGIRQKRKTAIIQARLDGEVAERIRIARDLHDRLGGLLTALKLRMPAGTDASGLVDQAIREMRNVSHHLLPDSLSRYGLRTALRDFCATMKNVSFSFVGEEQHIAHEEAIYCIVYELVNNAVKSAQAQHISVQLLAADDYTAVNVSDDGIGLNEADMNQGTGMTNIRERLAAIGGKIDIAATPGKGTEINIEIKNGKKDN